MVTRDNLAGKIVKFCIEQAIKTSYNLDNSNPVYEDTGVLGICYKDTTNYYKYVYWSNGKGNCYQEGELTLATAEEVSEYFRQINELTEKEKVKALQSLSYPLNTITKENLCYTKGN